MELEKHISLLILKHDCVIIPGLGGFISQRVQSTFTTGGKIIPPQKRILFNHNLQNDDGLLIGAVAIERKVAYKVAFQDVLRVVSYWKRKLIANERIEIESVGYLYQNEEGKIRFEQDTAINLLPSSYGLPILNDAFILREIVPSATEVTPEIAFSTFENNSVEISEEEKEIELLEKEFAKQTSKRNFNWVRYAAAIFLLPILFYSFWIPLKTDFLESHLISISDFNPFKKTTSIQYSSTKIETKNSPTFDLKNIQETIEKSEVEKSFSYEINETTYKNISLPEKEIQEETNFETPSETTITVTESTYYLIGNCFQVLDNAISFIQQMKDMNVHAEIVDQVNGLYRVSVGSANSTDGLQTVKENLNEKGITNFWILKK